MIEEYIVRRQSSNKSVYTFHSFLSYFLQSVIMKINVVIPLLFRHAIAASRTFTDDLGVKHEIAMDKPKIVTWAHTAVTLSHYGMRRNYLFLLLRFQN